jgi:hypothetical protein
MQYPAERRLNQLVRESKRKALATYLRQHGPKAVFAGMLWYALNQHSEKAEGYASHLFRELYGIWPRPCDRGEPDEFPGTELEEWIALRPKRKDAMTDARINLCVENYQRAREVVR